MEETDQSLVLVESRDAMDLVPRWEAEAWWYFVAAALVVFLLTLLFLLRRKQKPGDASGNRGEAYISAKKNLQSIQDSGRKDTAGKVSLILRGYLAVSMNEPALFETHEEFVGRGESLIELPEEMRESVVLFFAKLAEAKYAPDEPTSDSTEALVPNGLELLERIHNA